MSKYGKRLFVCLIIVLVVVSFNYQTYADDYSSLKKLQRVLYLIKNHHVKNVTLNKLVEGAINGMMDELDPFSAYMTPDEYNEMQLEFEGHFGGIGIVITIKNDKLTIISPIKGTPGEKVGLKAQDVITAINGKPTQNMSQKKAVELMRGEEGTEVKLTIKRKGKEKLLEFNIVRADIEIPYVESEMKEEKIGYIIVSQFAKDVGEKVEEGLKDLKKQGAEGIILDLRNNPGGMLTEAVKVASNFINEGVVVSVKQRENMEKILKADNTINAIDLPLVVLINGGSASASEIVAGAVQDYNRAELIGSRSFGKGTVQTLIPLTDGSALKLTTARYYTPEGKSIHNKGIKPDIKIEYDSEYQGDNQLERAIDFIESFISVKDFLNRAGRGVR